MANILEHLQETKVVNEAYRILKKNGHLYITIPFLLDVHQPPYDFHRYTYIYLTNLLVRQGFEIELFNLLEILELFRH
jgi:ubiquinone/menaquinone biosynthesis C-methylase UbiE